MLPNFLVIGAPKAATTSLCEMLRNHPEVFFSEPKEVHFFTDFYDRGMGWYEAKFAGAEKYRAIGEGGTTYSRLDEYPKAVERIARHLPDARFIYMVRHPLDRIESHYLQFVEISRATGSFVQELRRHPTLLETSRYLWQARQYYKFFPKDRMLVQFFEDFKKDPQQVFENCCRFLGINAEIKAEKSKTHLNTREEHLEDGALLAIVRKLPGFRRMMKMRHVVPAGKMRTEIWQFFRKPLTRDTTWDEPTLQWAIDQLAEDTRQFLRENGKPEDFYKLTMDRLEPRTVK